MMYRTTSSPNIGNTVSRTYPFILSFVLFQEEVGTEKGGTEQDGMASTSSQPKKARGRSKDTEPSKGQSGDGKSKAGNGPFKSRQASGVLPTKVDISHLQASFLTF